MNNAGSAGQALHYSSADNYYAQDEGLEHSKWFGKGAEYPGLSGKIDHQTLFKVLNGKMDGQEPDKWVKNEEAGEKERKYRLGADTTLSASKSVPLMAEVYGKRDVWEAHEAVVKKALNHIEIEPARTR